jgi:hypothetical protein
MDYDYDDEDTLGYDCDDDRSYQRLLAREGVERQCCYCDATFIGMPDHGVCNSCADKLEQGWDL